MSRKLLGFLLAMCLVVSTASAAIDLTAFDPELYDVELDEFDDTGFISLKNTISLSLNKIPTNNGLAIIIPTIHILETKAAVFSVLMIYEADNWCFVEDAIFIAGSQRYTFHDIPFRTGTYNDGSIYEALGVFIGKKSNPLLDYISKNQSATIKVRFVGKESNEEFALNATVIESIKLFYDTFVNAGGLEQVSSSIEARATDVTVK